mmetsp:Transcript_23797/g.61295  ORF Transcript_23797/g.61295 Transcript_23797/m.61295 type:complete len:218 (-) Transcript_23797:44-697(-)
MAAASSPTAERTWRSAGGKSSIGTMQLMKGMTSVLIVGGSRTRCAAWFTLIASPWWRGAVYAETSVAVSESTSECAEKKAPSIGYDSTLEPSTFISAEKVRAIATCAPHSSRCVPPAARARGRRSPDCTHTSTSDAPARPTRLSPPSLCHEYTPSHTSKNVPGLEMVVRMRSAAARVEGESRVAARARPLKSHPGPSSSAPRRDAEGAASDAAVCSR